MKRHRDTHQDAEVGFQIAPMIDVVFVIMLFFMVQAGDRQVETELKMKLPLPLKPSKMHKISNRQKRLPKPKR